MAVTTNHPIDFTLRKAIDYICNPDKTDGQLLTYSYGCSLDTADIEFEWTLQKAREHSKDAHLARHLIQSFEPGETTPEQAHEIGKRLADEVLGGKYEFVLTTHIDKGHIHNHIIFCDVDFINYKRSHVNKKWYYNTLKISDRLCKEYGLSIIPPTQNKGKTYKERAVANKGTSWKSKLKLTIDTVIPQARDFENFLRLMEQDGYEIKRGQYISLRAEGQERFTRLKAETLGADYSAEAITKRIAGKSKKVRARLPKTDNRINLLIDIQNCVKAQENKGYEHWAKINNLKQAAKTLNYLTEHNINTYDELEKITLQTHNDFDSISSKIKMLENEINHAAVLMKNINTYTSMKPIYQKYKTAKNKKDFAELHQSEIILFETAYKELKKENFPPIKELRKTYTELMEEKKNLYAEYKKLKAKVNEIDTIKSNIDTILGALHKPSREKSALLE